MREEKQFLKWMLFVTILIFGVANGIPAALILAIPEPLPPVAPLTQAWTYVGWANYPPDDTRFWDISIKAMLVSGTLNYEIDPKAGCGRYQMD